MYFLKYVSAEYEVNESVGNSSVGDLTDISVGEMSGVWVKMVSTMIEIQNIIRLILPVSHFLVKRLIHACVWLCLCRACERLIKTEVTFSHQMTDNFANCEANT